jgi:5-methylcytosine-specific restriction endonuclease McrA
MKNGKRDYKTEYAKYHGTEEQRKNRSKRTVLRNQANAKGITSKGDGLDFDHRKPLSKGGANTLSNARVTSKSSNRSFSRNSDGSLKSQTSKRERKK